MHVHYAGKKKKTKHSETEQLTCEDHAGYTPDRAGVTRYSISGMIPAFQVWCPQEHNTGRARRYPPERTC